jgi:hypothetical protein
MPNSSQSVYHLGLRYGALTTKPALIWLLVAIGRSSEAAALGTLMLVSTVIGMAMSNEAHLKLFALLFSETDQPKKAVYRELLKYLHSLVTHIVLMFIPAIVLCIWLFPNVNPVLAVTLALAERISDELLRIRLYRREWGRWTLLLLAKNLIPALAAMLSILFLEDSVDLSFALGGLVFALILLRISTRSTLRALKDAFTRLPNTQYVAAYLGHYARFLLVRQLAALLSLNVVLLDRYVGMNIWNNNQTAYILLMGQIVNGIFFALEAKHLSEHRANFINSTARLAGFWRWRPYVKHLAFCAVAAGIIFVAGTGGGLLPEMPTQSYIAVCILIINYAAFYLSVPFNDYLYYRGYAQWLAFGHAAIFLVYAISIFTFDALQSPPGALSFLAGLLIFRALLLAVAWKHIDIDCRSTTHF